MATAQEHADNVVGATPLLVENEEDVNAVDSDGMTALHHAAKHRNFKKAQYLLKNGAGVNAVDSDGVTALHLATVRVDVDMVELLVENGADVNAVDNSGWTALQIATEDRKDDSVDMAQFLVKNGADVNAAVADGKSTLHIAVAFESVDMVELLVENGADVNAADNDGMTALHIAAASGNLKMAQLLLEKGANLHAARSDGHAALRDVVFPWVEMPHIKAQDFYTIANVLCARGATWSPEWCRLPDDQTYTADSLAWCSGLLSCVLHWTKQSSNNPRPPLTNIPLENVRRGADSVETYLNELAQTPSDALVSRRKICVVGPSEGGKTSLIKSLEAARPYLVDIKDRTIGIDRILLSFSEETTVDGSPTVTHHEVTCWDFAGQDVYQVAHSLFFSKRTLYLLCVDLSAYATELEAANKLPDRENASRMRSFLFGTVFRWVRLILARQPDAEFVFVGTKADKLTPSKIEPVVDDLNTRLGQWTQQFLCEQEQTKLATLADGVHCDTPELTNVVDVDTLKKSLARLISSKIVVVSVTTDDAVKKAWQAVQDVIVDSQEDRSFVMPLMYTHVLEAVKRRCFEVTDLTDATGRVKKLITDPLTFSGRLAGDIAGLTREKCLTILRTLHDLGDVLWYERDVGGAFAETMILDPTLVLDIVREIVDHRYDLKGGEHYKELREEGVMNHQLLVAFPLWGALDEEMVHMFKKLLQFYHLAYPQDGNAMTPNSDLIVPTYWKVKQNLATIKSLTRQDSSLARQGLPGFSSLARWEYTVPAELSETLFDQFIVQSHLTFFSRTVAPTYVQATSKTSDGTRHGTTTEFIARIFYEEGRQSTDKIRIEVMAADESTCWRYMKHFVMKMEAVLGDYPGLQPERNILHSGGKAAVSVAAKLFEHAHTVNKDVATLRREYGWLPPDMRWFIEKAWKDPAKLEEIEMRERVAQIERQTTVLKNLIKSSDKKRLFPALWTLQYATGGSTLELQFLSDLSGKCFDTPMEIPIPPLFLAKYGTWIKGGLTILSVVAPRFITDDIVNTAIDMATSGGAKSVEHAQSVHNLVGQLDFGADGFKADGSQPNTMNLLRELLKLHDPPVDELTISTISNLQCAATEEGHFVWAHPHEIATMAKELKIYDEDKFRRELEEERERLASVAAQSVSTPPPSPGNTTTKSVSSPAASSTCLTTTQSPPTAVHLQFQSVSGLDEWDWRKTYCYWELVHKDNTATALQHGTTAEHADKTSPPSWKDQLFAVKGHYLDFLGDCTLVVKVKRPSRCFGIIKLIKQGEVNLAAHAKAGSLPFKIELAGEVSIMCQVVFTTPLGPGA